MSQFSIERLPNGFYRVFDRRSGLVALFNADGSHRSGDFTSAARLALLAHLRGH